MKHGFKVSLIPFLLFIVWPIAGASQEESGIATFQTDQGTTFSFDPQQVRWNIANPLDENSVFHLHSEESSGAKIVSATIVEDGQITRVYARDITFEMGTQSFLLKGDAEIVQGKNVLRGPLKIEFDSKSNKMVAVGTEEKPASFNYVRDDGLRIASSDQQVTFLFEQKNGGRRLVNIIGGKFQSSINQKK